MKIAVTGGAGFIGGWVVDELLERGHEPVIFDHAGRTNGREGVQFMMGDVRDATKVEELAAHVDGIIHLAAVLGTQETVGNPGPAAETNILGGVNVLNACKNYRRPLAYAGVGNFWHLNTYSTTKHTVERLLTQYRDEFGLRAVTVRPVNAYGPRQSVAPPFGPAEVRKITPAFVCRALCNQPLEVYGDGSQISDMVYVQDVANVFISALEVCAGGKVPTTPVEVGPSEHLTVRMVAEKVNELVGNAAGVEFKPMRRGEKATADVDVNGLAKIAAYAHEVFTGGDLGRVLKVLQTLDKHVFADNSTLTQVGMSSDTFTSLDEGLVYTVNWFKANEGITWHAP